jgi:catechol 2,3-dioxygenase
MMAARLPDDFRLGPAALRVSDAARALDFYERNIGLEVLDRSSERVTLGAGGVPVLYLDIQPGAAPRNYKESGLYHVAILVPDRPQLGATIARLAANNVKLGAADHLVSEAIYIWDPDNNGIEIYRDRPRGEWIWNGDQVQMANRPLDFQGLLAESDVEKLSRAPLKAGTRIGHIHLEVDDLNKAKNFYSDVFGLLPTATLPGALFMAAGGYHHHLGTNIWESRNGPPPSPDTAGLSLMSVELQDAASLEALKSRLEAASISVSKNDRGFSFIDPWHTPVAVQLRT